MAIIFNKLSVEVLCCHSQMSDAPYEREGPSWEEARTEYLAKFKDGTYNQDVVNSCVREHMEENGNGGDMCQFGSYRGFWMCFRTLAQKSKR